MLDRRFNYNVSESFVNAIFLIAFFHTAFLNLPWMAGIHNEIFSSGNDLGYLRLPLLLLLLGAILELPQVYHCANELRVR